MKTYLYARISRKSQNIQRQITNLTKAYPDGILIQEAFTGTKINRPKFDYLLKQVKSGDTIVFDSVSRMSRNAEEGFKLYQELLEKGVELVFLKESHIDTKEYKERLSQANVSLGANKDEVIQATETYIKTIANIFAKRDIIKAFEQSQKEVDDLRERTKEGIREARRNGKQIGGVTGKKLTTKKSIKSKEDIKKYSKDFEGTLKDIEVMKLIGISRNSYYKYKKELIEELQNKN